MDSDDGSKTAPRTSNNDDVLMLRPGQTLQQLVRLGLAHAVHERNSMRQIEEPERCTGPAAGPLLSHTAVGAFWTQPRALDRRLLGISVGYLTDSPSEQTVAVDEASVDPDPMTQLSRWLEVARTAGEPMPEAMAVATATTDGRPSSRMVLLRGIDHRGLVFYTDRESDKGRELRANPFAAALFHWFLPVHRQVRVTGAVEVVDDDQSDAYWRSRPPRGPS